MEPVGLKENSLDTDRGGWGYNKKIYISAVTLSLLAPSFIHCVTEPIVDKSTNYRSVQ